MSTKIYENLLIDKETGEVLREQHIYRKNSDYKYFQTAMGTVEHIEQLTASQYKLTGILQPYVQFDTNRIDLSVNQKKSVAISMGIEVRSFYKLFKSLKSAGWIIEHQGYQIMNPEYIWAGKVSIRSKILDEIREDRLNKLNI